MICRPTFVGEVRGDPHRLQQVVVNLLGNAIKFTERGQVKVHVVIEREDDEQMLVRFAVEDTGIGVPPERLDRLFQAFSQVDASTTRQFGGTGLGLAIARQLVELMGGDIGVTSRVGRGSTFWFRLPMLKNAARDSTRQLTPDELRQLRVLVVDDNATNREILFRQLSAWQMRVQTASDGPTALDIMQRAAARRRVIRPGNYRLPHAGHGRLRIGSASGVRRNAACNAARAANIAEHARAGRIFLVDVDRWPTDQAGAPIAIA